MARKKVSEMSVGRQKSAAIKEYQNQQRALQKEYHERFHERKSKKSKELEPATIPKYVGARNPYALAEAISKEPIDWAHVDRESVLEKTIGSLNLKNGADSVPLTYASFFDPAFNSAIYPKNDPPKMLSEKSKIKPSLKHNNVGNKGADVGAAYNTPCDENLPDIWGKLNPNTLFAHNPPRADGPCQGCPPDCWLIAALSSLAWTERLPLGALNSGEIPIQRDNGDFDLFSIDDATIPIKSNKPVFARSKFTESWPAIYEYFMTKFKKPDSYYKNTNYPDIPHIGSGDPQYASAHLTDNMSWDESTRKTCDPAQSLLSASDTWTDLTDNCSTALDIGFAKILLPTAAWTFCTSATNLPHGDCTIHNSAPNAEFKDEILAASHAYSVLGTMVSDADEKYVILRNPWGGIPNANNEYFLYSRVEDPMPYTLADPLNIRLYLTDNFQHHLLAENGGYRPVRDGIFGLLLEDFVRYFAGYGWIY